MSKLLYIKSSFKVIFHKTSYTLLITILLILSSCKENLKKSEIYLEKGQTKLELKDKKIVIEDSTEAKEIKVYSQDGIFRTNTGEKYHTEKCRYLSQSKILIFLSEAKDLELEPCKVCKPFISIGQIKTEDFNELSTHNRELAEKIIVIFFLIIYLTLAIISLFTLKEKSAMYRIKNLFYLLLSMIGIGVFLYILIVPNIIN